MKYLDSQEALDLGIIQEINRLLLHPRGLALEVNVDSKSDEFNCRIQDHRDDPEGVYFGITRDTLPTFKQKSDKFYELGKPIQPIEINMLTEEENHEDSSQNESLRKYASDLLDDIEKSEQEDTEIDSVNEVKHLLIQWKEARGSGNLTKEEAKENLICSHDLATSFNLENEWWWK